MRLNLNPEILAALAEGVILLDSQARYLHSNTAGERWLPFFEATAKGLARLVGEEQSGRVQLPVRVDTPTAPYPALPTEAKAFLCKNGRREYALVIVNPKLGIPSPTSPCVARIDERASFALMGPAVCKELQALVEQLQLVTEFSAQCEAFAGQAQVVSGLLRQVLEMSALMGRDAAFADERICVKALIHSVLPPIADERSLHCEILVEVADDCVVYGHPVWLGRAVGALARTLCQGAPPQGMVEVAVWRIGDFVVVTGRVSIASRWRPAQQALGVRQENDSLRAPSAAPAGLKAVLVDRVIELHGGQLRWASAPTANADVGPESFTLSLPTGLPTGERSRASCAECRYPLQTQRYAQDLAQLMVHPSHAAVER